MPHFLVKLIAPRPILAMDMDAQERAMVAEHFDCWKSRRDAGEVIVFEAGALSHGTLRRRRDRGCGRSRGARDADPAIKSNRGLAGEVYPMRAVARAATTSA
jgi:hypothetical protein